ncbi:hypothetical protein [Escherichia phage vB-Eco-KMB25]|nr:hypothetical protein [Escherichia phage vB-Eco-KMB25]
MYYIDILLLYVLCNVALNCGRSGGKQRGTKRNARSME